MATYTNDTGARVVLPTLDPPVVLEPGETVEIPDPEPPEGAYDPGRDTVAGVLDWVGTDPTRAAQALATEEQKPQPRKSLVEQLAALIHPED